MTPALLYIWLAVQDKTHECVMDWEFEYKWNECQPRFWCWICKFPWVIKTHRAMLQRKKIILIVEGRFKWSIAYVVCQHVFGLTSKYVKRCVWFSCMKLNILMKWTICWEFRSRYVLIINLNMVYIKVVTFTHRTQYHVIALIFHLRAVKRGL